jgi:hypothetical protein
MHGILESSASTPTASGTAAENASSTTTKAAAKTAYHREYVIIILIFGILILVFMASGNPVQGFQLLEAALARHSADVITCMDWHVRQLDTTKQSTAYPDGMNLARRRIPISDAPDSTNARILLAHDFTASFPPFSANS